MQKAQQCQGQGLKTSFSNTLLSQKVALRALSKNTNNGPLYLLLPCLTQFDHSTNWIDPIYEPPQSITGIEQFYQSSTGIQWRIDLNIFQRAYGFRRRNS